MRDGKIAAVGTRAQVEARKDAKRAEKLDVGGRVILPGFVDSHTHLIHAASRAEEYELKTQGASYEEIAKKGGGILNSVKRLRAASADALKMRARAALEEFASYGTTTVEAKSGYGLNVASELKILKLQRELNNEQPLEIVSTFLGAHVVPEEFRSKPDGAERYIALLIEQMLPEVVNEKLAEFCDVFCDRGAFTRAQAQASFERRASAWAGASFTCGAVIAHGSDTTCRGTGSGELRSPGTRERNGHPRTGELRHRGNTVAGMRFSSWLGELRSSAGVDRLRSDRGTGHGLQSRNQSDGEHANGAFVGVFATAHDAGGSDCGGDDQRGSQPAAREKIGSLEAGKQADLAVFEVEDYREIPYYFGMQRCWMTIKSGEIIYMRRTEGE